MARESLTRCGHSRTGPRTYETGHGGAARGVARPRTVMKRGPRGNGSAVLKQGEKRGFVTPTEPNVHGDALCFIVKTWARHKTSETALNTGCRLAVGGGWRLAVGGWQLAVGGWWFLGAVLNKKNWVLKDSPG